MLRAETRVGFKPNRAMGNDSLVLYPASLGDRLRANAELLETAVKSRRYGRQVLRALVNDLHNHADEADRLVEAQAWLNAAAPGRPARRAAA